MNLKSLLIGLPQVVQYIAVLGLVMLILYVCLTLTRIFGSKYGEKQTYDNPEEYEKQVPDLFASTFMKRKPKSTQKENNSGED